MMMIIERFHNVVLVTRGYMYLRYVDDGSGRQETGGKKQEAGGRRYGSWPGIRRRVEVF